MQHAGALSDRSELNVVRHRGGPVWRRRSGRTSSAGGPAPPCAPVPVPKLIARLSLALLAVAPLSARAQDTDAHVYVAADPLPYVLHGFSFHVGAVLPGGRFSLEAAIFSSRLSESLITLVESKDQGFTARLNGLTFEAYWHAVQWERNALLLGLQAHFDDFTPQYRADPAEGDLKQIYLFPTVAYRWFPIDGAGFFVKPFVSLGLPLLGSKTAATGAQTFYQLPVFPLATVIVGWQF